MSFDIHVAATGGYRYNRRGIAHGDEWDIRFMRKQIRRVVRRALGVRARLGRSPTERGTEAALRAMSAIYQLELMEQTLSFLMLAGRGRITITVRHEHIAWPTTGGIRTFELAGDPRDVGTDILTFLAENDMNNWGPLIEILAALSGYEMHSHRSHSTERNHHLILITLSD
jgi:hypothetical protein